MDRRFVSVAVSGGLEYVLVSDQLMDRRVVSVVVSDGCRIRTANCIKGDSAIPVSTHEYARSEK